MIPRPKAIPNYLRLNAQTFILLQLNVLRGPTLSYERSLKHDRVTEQKIQFREFRQTFDWTAGLSFRKTIEQDKQTRQMEISFLIKIRHSFNEIDHSTLPRTVITPHDFTFRS